MLQKTKQNVPASYGSYLFWKITSSWWFFLALYILLVLTLVIILNVNIGDRTISNDFEQFGSMFLMTLYFMPNGLLFFLSYLEKFDFEYLVFVFPAVFHLFWIISVIIMQILKYKRKTILRWLILTILILMILSFAGCTAMVLKEGVGLSDIGFL